MEQIFIHCELIALMKYLYSLGLQIMSLGGAHPLEA